MKTVVGNAFYGFIVFSAKQRYELRKILYICNCVSFCDIYKE